MIFLTKNELLGIHRRALAEFGGSPGVLDDPGLESALVAAENRRWYEEADLPTCAATYAFHLAKAHAFVDGNKRVAAAAAEAFLLANGAVLVADDDELCDLYLAIAAGQRSRADVEDWFRRHIQQR